MKELEAESQEVELKEASGVAESYIPYSTTYATDRNTQTWNNHTLSTRRLESQLKVQIDQICDLLETLTLRPFEVSVPRVKFLKMWMQIQQISNLSSSHQGRQRCTQVEEEAAELAQTHECSEKLRFWPGGKVKRRGCLLLSDLAR